ncbi:putative tryptophan 2,3-dioxygenase [Peptostreptococcaceae bacterium oral taxon 113 str. W5053]|nr:putative tryptophan 2,3-dioxygenase [Peptostreptococcaceae bacterium oral taxon 113 str. W5053]
MKKYVPEPFRIKMVEPLKTTTREERIEALKEAHYNMFNLRGDMVYIDLLTDSGTNAMSDKQWGGVMVGDEAYAGGKSYFKLVDAGKDIFNYAYIQPVHQGRAAEKVFFPTIIKKGQVAISNMFFDTTRAHVTLAGGKPIDCVCQEAKKPSVYAPFKGNMDVEKLEQLILEYGKENVGMILMTVTNNSAGGQAVSIQNIREVAAIAKKYGILFNIDAARFAENAYFVKIREEEFKNSSIKEIVREMFSYADSFTMSAKKDAIVNMGGLIGIRENAELYQAIKGNCISFEGFVTYGGLSGRDLEALAIGLYEGIDDEYLRYRNASMEYLASKLLDAGVAIQNPAGGHGVYVDANAMFPHIPYYEFPGHTLCVELYKEAGIRTCDIGSFMLGNDPETGEQIKSEFEFARLAIPRRVYTQSHMDVIADALINIKARASEVSGYRITWEPPILRHFQAHLEPVQ